MIRHIHGIVAATDVLSVIIDVNGVGYRVFTTNGNSYQIEGRLLLHTHLAVRENALDLYGFATQTELEIFEQLLTIPKIGPKSALEIMSKADVLTIKNAVVSNDPSYLTKVSGIGQKTAEKIVNGLKDSFANSDISPLSMSTPSNASSDAIDALVALGYPPQDARRAVLQLPTSITTANEAVREALKILGQS